MAERLFDVYVLSCLQGIQDHLVMPVFGRGNQNSIDILVVEKVAIRAVLLWLSPAVRRCHCNCLFQVGSVDVTDSGNLNGWIAQEGRHYKRTPSARPNHSQPKR